MGEALIAIGKRPAVDFYFPLVWFGYILTLDGILARLTGSSIFQRSRRLFYLMIPVSALFWWIFELFDAGVGSWSYVNAEQYRGISFLALASVSFSTVLLAVWESAMVVRLALPVRLDRGPRAVFGRGKADANIVLAEESLAPPWLDRLMWSSVAAGVASVVLPLLFPKYAFGLIWISLFFLLDPVNYWLGRSSLLAQMAAGCYRTALSFALGTLVCGFFWESWNYWVPMKWVYDVPFVSQWHLFEMPVLGYSGYIPFGLELYAMAAFLLPPLAGLLGIGPLELSESLYSLDISASEEPKVRIPA